MVSIIGNLVIRLGVLIVPDFEFKSFNLVFGFSDKLGMATRGVSFGIGLFTAYCLCRLKFPDLEDNKNPASEMMASFQYQTHSTKRWFFWLFSITAGVINVLLLILVDSVLSKKL